MNLIKKMLPIYLEYSNNLIKINTTSMLHYYMTVKIEYGTTTFQLKKGKYIAGPFMTYIFMNSLLQVDDRIKIIDFNLEMCDIFIHDDNLSIEDNTYFDRKCRYIKTDKADTMEHLFESFNEPQYQVGYNIKSKEFYMTELAYNTILSIFVYEN